MSDTVNVLDAAENLGWTTSTVSPEEPDYKAGLLLKENSHAVVVDATDLYAHIYTDELPTAAQITAWERVTGRAVTITVTTPEVISGLTARRKLRAAGGIQKFLTLFEDLLVKDATGFVPLKAVFLQTGKQPQVFPDFSGRKTTYPLFTVNDLEDIRTSLGGNHAVLSHDKIRVEVTVSETTAVIKFFPETLPTAEQLWLPEAVGSLTKPGGGLLIVASGKFGGKTALAQGIGTYVAAKRGGSKLTVGKCFWPAEKNMLHVDTLEEAQNIPVDTIVVDMDELNYSKVAKLAGQGSLVIVTVTANSIVNALTLAKAYKFAHLVKGVIVRTLVTDLVKKITVPVDSSILFNTQELAGSLKKKNYHTVEAAVEAGGHIAGTLHDTALASVVNREFISPETAAKYVQVQDRYAAALGRLAERGGETVDDIPNWDWEEKA